ncbi:cobyrinic acid a,c-diamide synthase [Methanobrevibacter sp.]|uniref:nucleotide-binding protein n=1 Tax=Methanobrevibacter sp. TaxID=66852 RepID=UPI00388F851C
MKGKFLINGRGGCGKSTLTSIIAKNLAKDNQVLVIDIDEGNLGINKMLGVERPETTFMDYCGGRGRVMGELVKVILQQEDAVHIVGEISFDDLEAPFASWSDNLGFIQMGKIENPGDGCSCPISNLAMDFIANLKLDDNQVVIVDTSAGIEHIGQGVAFNIDKLITVVDGSNDAVILANKINEMAKKADKDNLVILNKVDDSIEGLLKEKLDDDINVVSSIKYAPEIAESNINGVEIDISNIDVGDIIAKL